MSIDFRKCLYALSDVIINRPPPLRAFDQIYMKVPDMLLQADLLGRWFAGRRVVFIGDGDAVALAYVHLTAMELLAGPPAHVTVLDFDERVVNSVNHFADRHDLQNLIHAELYNVIDPLPPDHWEAHDAFYTNPPWGGSNDGASVCHFAKRGVEACSGNSRGSIVIGDHHNFPWTHRVQFVTQSMLIARGFRVAEMLPEFHRYHLDDSPELTSCAMLFERVEHSPTEYDSGPLSPDELANFYGKDLPPKYRYVRDLTNGGKYMSRDAEMEPL